MLPAYPIQQDIPSQGAFNEISELDKRLLSLDPERAYKRTALTKHGLFGNGIQADLSIICLDGYYLGAQIIEHYLSYNNLCREQFPSTVHYKPLSEFLRMSMKDIMSSVELLIRFYDIPLLREGKVKIPYIFEVYQLGKTIPLVRKNGLEQIRCPVKQRNAPAIYEKSSQWLESPEERERLILAHLPLVKFIADRIANRLPPNIEVYDLIAAGVIGMLDAIEKYDHTKEVKFRTYAEFRIRGAILDELREGDFFPRPTREKIKRLENTTSVLEQKLGRSPDPEEIAARMDIPLEKYYKLEANMHLSIISLEDIDTIRRNYFDPNLENIGISDDGSWEKELFYNFLDSEKKKILLNSIESLLPKDKMIISLYYYDKLTMREIGEVMGLAESTISERHTNFIRKLRSSLEPIKDSL